MKKNFVYLILTVCVIFAGILPVCASDYLPLYDEADLLSDSEEAALIEKLENIGWENQMEIVIAAVETTGDYTPMEYADDFYDYNGYGYGDGRDGLLLLVAMDTRDWWISTRGEAIRVFTDAGIDYIGEQIVPYLAAGDYYGAFSGFADLCGDFMTQARYGEPYDSYDYEDYTDDSFRPGKAFLIAFVIGVAAALIYTGSLKSQLKTVAAKNSAADYVRQNSLNITNSRDFFLYRQVHRTARESSSGRSSSGGGSSSHRSSSGSSHGGGGGKF